ncbi:glycosyltransferase [Microvirga terrae]|uniref:Glycosyltransferase n=1 Tax=Microvirga terrae TaxID=2740529 RepID=A0ABY5RN70_9HYPH|nr:glycosyltransferase [Microvirga terrae]UVF18398.1 glycosyltransferase [Microvirga terrae]
MFVRSLLNRALWGIKWRYRYRWHPALRDNLRGYTALAAARCWWHVRKPQKAHDLPGDLVISLTSYEPRFNTLVFTLRCLLSQTIRPDRTVLWLAHGDTSIPPEIVDLCQYGLEIRYTTDIKSYKKIIPSLRAFPHAFIVTADDDTYYGPHWLEHLIKAWEKDQHQIVCRVARQVTLNQDGSSKAYKDWEYASAPEVSPSLLPIGVGGVLYPPNSLHPDVLDEQTFQELCPSGDDLWLYWMGRRAKTIYKKIGGPGVPPTWPTSQKRSLFHENLLMSKNDQQIGALTRHFGFPVKAQPN